MRAGLDELRSKYGTFPDTQGHPGGQGPPRVIVVDANVAAKWYLPELGTEAALELVDGRGRWRPPI